MFSLFSAPGAPRDPAHDGRVAKNALLAMFLMMLALLAPEAMAQGVPGVSLPWEGGLCRFAKAFTGPWLGWVAVIAIVVAAVAFAVGESNSPMTTAMRWAGGFSIAVGAVAIVGFFFPGVMTTTTCT